MRRRVWGAFAVIAAVVAWQAASCEVDTDANLGINRPWIERVPKSERDVVGHFLVLDHPRARIGMTGRSARWKHELELFRWALENDRLQLHFPHSGKKEKRSMRVWRCEGEAPRPFDLCMELTSDAGRERFYSREDWKIEPKDAAAELAELAEEAPELGGLPLPPDGFED